MDEYTTEYERLKDKKKILPGHGKAGSKDLVLEQTKYLLDKKNVPLSKI